LHAERHGNIRHFSYAKPIFESLRTYVYPEIRVSAPDGEDSPGRSVSGRWVFVMNLPCYARGLPIAPEASGLDGLFDVCTFRAGSWWNALRYLSVILRRRHAQEPDCTTFRASKLRLESDVPTPFQIDGDPGGWLPVEIEILPERLTLLAPESWTAKYL
jgi:diacylglycerol kinase family enzyme